MSPDIKKLWCNALRSDDYIQGEGALKFEDEYCCLGVLCDIHRQLTNNGDWVDDDEYEVKDGDSCDMKLPLEVQDWTGLLHDDPIVLDGAATLASLNDDGYTFEEIADIIESEL